MAAGEYKLAIAGFGGMGSWHEELIRSIDGLTVAGIYDIKEVRKKDAEGKGLYVYESLEELLEDKSVNIVLVATPNDLHKPIAIRAMEAGKCVVCEKPVTLSSADLEEMIEASKRTNTFLTVHQNRRFDEDFLTVREILRKKMLGDVFCIESRVQGSRGIPGDWRQKKEHGGGMVLDWGVHLFDQLLLMMGGDRVKQVYATLTNVTNQLVDDGFMAELVFESGMIARVEVGTNNFITLPRWYVLGENGTVVIRDFGQDAQLVLASGKQEEDVIPVKTAAGLTKTMAPRREDTISSKEIPLLKSDIRDFYKNVMAVLDGREEAYVRLDEVMRVMLLMEAVFEAAERRQVIRFEV